MHTTICSFFVEEQTSARNVANEYLKLLNTVILSDI